MLILFTLDSGPAQAACREKITANRRGVIAAPPSTASPALPPSSLHRAIAADVTSTKFDPDANFALSFLAMVFRVRLSPSGSRADARGTLVT
jgi:hypothetical protein